LFAKRYILTLAYGVLSEAELESYFAKYNLNYRVVGRMGRCLIIETEQLSPRFWSGLAGVHKVAEVFSELTGNASDKLDLHFLADSATDKMKWAVSTYAADELSAQEFAENLKEVIKEAFKSMGVAKTKIIRGELSKIGPSWEYEVSSQQLQKEDILREGLEISAVKLRGWLIGRTVWVVDHLGFRRRDLERPIQDPKITMPPKLAKVIVNLTGCKKGDVLLDPFCGLGTILGEAAMNGVNVIGIDADAKRVEGAHRNLNWLLERYKIKGVRVELHTGRAERLDKILKRRIVDAVATEPILLPPLRQPPPDQEAENLLKRSSETYYRCLPSISKHLKSRGRAAIVVPCVRTRSRRMLSFDLSREAEKVGLRPCTLFSIKEYPILVEDPSQRVMRRIYVFEKEKG